MSVDDDEQVGPGSAEVARWTPADLPPGLEYFPAEIEQHEMDQLQREYDAGMYRDDLGAYTVQDQVGLPDRSPAYGEAWQATVARLDAAEASERAETAEQIAADWARTTALSIDPNGPVEVDSRERLQARVDALQAGVRYLPPPRQQPHQANADYPSTTLANTRVVVAQPGVPGTVESTRFQTELAIAQQVAAQQVRAQQQADEEATARSASAALGQYIAPPRSVPARSMHR